MECVQEQSAVNGIMPRQVILREGLYVVLFAVVSLYLAQSQMPLLGTVCLVCSHMSPFPFRCVYVRERGRGGAAAAQCSRKHMPQRSRNAPTCSSGERTVPVSISVPVACSAALAGKPYPRSSSSSSSCCCCCCCGGGDGGDGVRGWAWGRWGVSASANASALSTCSATTKLCT